MKKNKEKFKPRCPRLRDNEHAICPVWWEIVATWSERQLVLVREGDTGPTGLAELRDKNCSRARIKACWRAVRSEELGR